MHIKEISIIYDTCVSITPILIDLHAYIDGFMNLHRSSVILSNKIIRCISLLNFHMSQNRHQQVLLLSDYFLRRYYTRGLRIGCPLHQVASGIWYEFRGADGVQAYYLFIEIKKGGGVEYSIII